MSETRGSGTFAVRLGTVTLLLVSLSLVACSSQPRINVHSNPPGADVTLQLVYERERDTHVLIVRHREVDEPQITDEIPLGQTPLRYSFPQSETESYVGVRRLSQRVRRHYVEGILLIEKEGYEPKEVIFPVRRGTTEIEVEMTPLR